MIGATVLVGALGLLAGLAVADLTTTRAPQGTTPEVAGPPTTGGAATSVAPTTATTAPASTTTTEPVGTSPPITSATTTSTAPTTTTATVPGTTAPTLATTTTAAPTTTRPRTTTTTRGLPAVISVSYLQDASGALVVPKRGGATITLLNSGGQPGQWLLSPIAGSGFTMAITSGTLGPGQSLTLTVTDQSGTSRSSSLSGIVAPNTRVTIGLVVR